MSLSAGKMREKVKLDLRTETNPDAPNDYGNTVSDWAEQGEVWAEFIHLKSGEAVISGRLQGRHSMVVRLRPSSLTRQITTDWRLRDARRGTEFAIRDVTQKPGVIDLLCESGIAA